MKVYKLQNVPCSEVTSPSPTKQISTETQKNYSSRLWNFVLRIIAGAYRSEEMVCKWRHIKWLCVSQYKGTRHLTDITTNVMSNRPG